MAEYVSAPVAVDPDELKDNVYDALRAQFPGWEPADGNLDVWMIEAFCEVAAQIGESVTFVLRAIFRYFGQLVNVPPIEATSATATVTVTVIDTAGYTLPAGATVAWDAGGELVGFQTSDDVVIAPGASTASGVSMTAITPGAIGNGLSGDAQLVDEFDFVASVNAASPTTGGADAEDDDTYLDRLADELRLLTPRPILPEDFATLAKSQSGVERATVLDGYNPADDTFSNERMVYVVVVDASGEAVASGVKTNVAAYLEALREVNFVVNVGDPTYTTVDVSYTAHAWPGWDPAVVKAQADAALATFLSPASWGQPTFGETRSWVNEPKVRYLEVAQALNSVEGLRYLDTLTVNGGAVDVTMSGRVALPRAGTITGSVTAS